VESGICPRSDDAIGRSGSFQRLENTVNKITIS
jgi:hypothetical protein